MKQISISLILIGLFAFSSNGQLLTQTFSAEKDALVNSEVSAVNFGADTLLNVYQDTSSFPSIQRFYLSFDVSSIPTNAIIHSATLKLYVESEIDSLDNSVYLERVDDSWIENTITWANKPEIITTGQVEIDSSLFIGGNYTNINVLQHVQHMVNYPLLNNGWSARLQNEIGGNDFGVIFGSEESVTGKQPILEIQYILPPEINIEVEHCTPGNNDGAIDASLTGGGIPYHSTLYKVIQDTSQAGNGSISGIVYHGWEHLNDSIIDYSGLEPGVYFLRILDSLYQSAPNLKYEFHKYFFVGRQGETTEGIFLPTYRYYENMCIRKNRRDTIPSISNMANTNYYVSNPHYIGVASTRYPPQTSTEWQYEDASLIKYNLAFDEQLNYESAELTMRGWTSFYRSHNSSNAANYSLVTENWEEDIVTWNTRPSIDSTFKLTRPTTSTIGYHPNALSWDTLELKPFFDFWKENPEDNFGFELALQNYGQPDFAARGYKQPAGNTHYLKVKFSPIYQPIIVTADVEHCTSGNSDGSVDLSVSSGSGAYNFYWVYKSEQDSTVSYPKQVLTLIDQGSTVNDSIIDQNNLEPGMYLFRVRDTLWDASTGYNNATYYKNQYFLIGREGEETECVLTLQNYSQGVQISNNTGDYADSLDWANQNQKPQTKLGIANTAYVPNTVYSYELASLLNFEIDFPASLIFNAANLRQKGWSSFYQHTNSSNASLYRPVIEPWDEDIVTWNSRPAIDSTVSVYLAPSAVANGNTPNSYDSLSILNLVEYWQQNPNYGFEMALESYDYPNYADRSHKPIGGNESYFKFSFEVKPAVTSTFNDTTELGKIYVDAPAGDLPYKYLLSYEPLPDLNDIWQILKDSLPIDSSTFFTGDVNNRSFVFDDIDAERYYVGVYDNNGLKIEEAEVIVNPEILVYESTGVNESADEFTVEAPAYTEGIATLYALLPEEEDGGFEFEIANLDDDIVIGFNSEFDTIVYEDSLYEFGFRVNSSFGEFEIFRGNTNLRIGTIAINDQIRLVKNQGDLIVYKNGLEEFTFPYDQNDGSYKVEMKLKGPLSVINKPFVFGGLKRPKPIFTNIVHPECPSKNASYDLEVIQGFFKYQSVNYIITDLVTNQVVYSGANPNTVNLSVGVYNISYSYTALIGGNYVSVPGSSQQFTIGHPIEWTNLTNTSSVASSLNTITPTSVNNVSTANSINISQNNEINWVEFNWNGTATNFATNNYSWAWGQVYLEDPLGNKLGNTYIINPGFGLVTGFAYAFDANGLVSQFYHYKNKPIRIEFNTSSGLTPSFNLISDGVSIIQNGPADLGATNKFQFFSTMVASNSLPTKGQRIFLENSLASFCQYVQNPFVAKTKTNYGADYYFAISNELLFQYTGEYNRSELSFELFNSDNALVANTDYSVVAINETTAVKKNADNRYLITAGSNLLSDTYLLKITNLKGEDHFIRFKI